MKIEGIELLVPDKPPINLGIPSNHFDASEGFDASVLTRDVCYYTDVVARALGGEARFIMRVSLDDLVDLETYRSEREAYRKQYEQAQKTECRTYALCGGAITIHTTYECEAENIITEALNAHPKIKAGFWFDIAEAEETQS